MKGVHDEDDQTLFKTNSPNSPNSPIEKLADGVHTVKPIGAYVGRCPICGRDGVISFRYETVDGESGDMCTFCGQELLNKIKGGEMS